MFAAPTATINGSSSLSPNGSQISATLTGAPPWNLTWSDGFVQNSVPASPAQRTVTPQTTTTYTVTAVSDLHCTGTVAGSGWTVTVGQPPAAPAGVTATATSSTAVRIAWSLSNGATSYDVLRASSKNADTNQVYSVVASGLGPSTTAVDDNGASPNTTYLYRVRAVNAAGTTLSAYDVATTVIFVNHAIVYAQDFIDLRTAVNAMRAAANLTPTSFPNDIYPGGPVVLTHLTTLRAALDGARQTLVLPAMSYGEPTNTLVAGVTTIKAQHVAELRGGVQ